MKIFLIILMFVVTVYGVQQIMENGKKASTFSMTDNHATGLACEFAAIVTVVFDVLLAYMVVMGV